MAGRVLQLQEIWRPDNLGIGIARRYQDWVNFRQPWIKECMEVRNYIFATDTTNTTNSKLPWKNKTTIPKICQIRDNLLANYMAAIFPKRKWLYWEADGQDDNSKSKRDNILNYIGWAIQQPGFKNTVLSLLCDYVDTGNCFAAADWIDQTVVMPDKTQSGFVGPTAKRYSPYEVVMNPIGPEFTQVPKIIRSMVTMGEVKAILENETTPENVDMYKELWSYLQTLRNTAGQLGQGDLKAEDSFLKIDGFNSYRAYLESDYCELLTFYGDLWDRDANGGAGEYYRNQVIVVVDRHKVILNKPNPSYFGYPPIFHCGWRKRQDNLWAMGPLANIIGLQYRIDHIENLKADCFDLITFPPLKIKGYVNDFEWGPFARIHVGDDGDIEMMAPPFQVLQANQEILNYMNIMEEIAGSPKEAMGFRTPGEKTAYEVQRLENAASRIFMHRIAQFEEQVLEPLLNAMLELARRNLSRATTIPVFDPEFDITVFETLSVSDLTGSGKIRPVAARHFTEQAELIQNVTNFYNSALAKDPQVMVHWSGYNTARLVEDVLNLKDYNLVGMNVRLSEEADSRREAQAHTEATQMEAMTPSGLTPDDMSGPPLLGGSSQGAGGTPLPQKAPTPPQSIALSQGVGNGQTSRQ